MMAQLDAVGLRAARRFPQDLLGSGGAQLLHLRVEPLPSAGNDGLEIVSRALLEEFSRPVLDSGFAKENRTTAKPFFSTGEPQQQ
jgi:hypothetical protein